MAITARKYAPAWAVLKKYGKIRIVADCRAHRRICKAISKEKLEDAIYQFAQSELETKPKLAFIYGEGEGDNFNPHVLIIRLVFHGSGAL